MIRPIRIGVPFADVALGVAAEAVDRTEGPCSQHLALPNAAAHPTHLDPLMKKSSAPPATEIRSGRFKATSPKQRRT